MKKQVTMDEIAESLHISKSLVSRALNNKYGVNEKSRQAIVAQAVEMGYDFSGIHSRSTAGKNILLVIEKYTLGDQAFFMPVIHGVERALYNSSMIINIVTFEPHQEDCADVINTIMRSMPLGFITLGRASDTFIRSLKGLNLPFVAIDPLLPLQDVDCVMADNFGGCYEATARCIAQGHRRIAFVGSKQYSLSFRERFHGYEYAMEEAGLPVLGVTSIHDHDAIPFNTAELTALLECGDRPTAFVCGNDSIAVRLYHIFNSLGLHIPGDVSVVGFDNGPASQQMVPTITTVDIPKELMGETAVNMLVRRAKEKDRVAQTVTLHTALVERQSTRELSAAPVRRTG